MDTNTLPIAGDYQAYDNPKKCLYKCPDGKYNYISGWDTPKETMVIGETEHCYIYELRPISDFNVFKYLLPIGFHKSRLIKWLPTQLQMFA